MSNTKKNTIKGRFSDKHRVHPKISGASMAQQHMAADTDINNIVSRYIKTGVMPPNTRRPTYADFTGVDYMEMRNAIADIDQEFAGLPSRIRNRFQNDPHQLVRFLEKPENQAEAIKLGLIPDPNPPAEPAKVSPEIKPDPLKETP